MAYYRPSSLANLKGFLWILGLKTGLITAVLILVFSHIDGVSSVVQTTFLLVKDTTFIWGKEDQFNSEPSRKMDTTPAQFKLLQMIPNVSPNITNVRELPRSPSDYWKTKC